MEHTLAIHPPLDTPYAITRERMAELPLQQYRGAIHLIDTQASLEQAQADIMHDNIVGLDTETRPSFRRGEKHLPCLVQIATSRAAYLFPLRKREVAPVLAAVLAAPEVVKAGVALAHDLFSLKQVFAFGEQNVLDLGKVAKSNGYQQTGLRNLAGLLLGYRIPKGASTSNWAATNLSAKQIVYAATDAWVCRELYLRFLQLGMVSDAGDSRLGIGD